MYIHIYIYNDIYIYIYIYALQAPGPAPPWRRSARRASRCLSLLIEITCLNLPIGYNTIYCNLV